MFQYKKYLISKTDSFQPTNFPKVMNELSALKKNLNGSSTPQNTETFISFLRKRSSASELIRANPEFSNLINSDVIATTHLTSLFECSEDNKEFQKQFEDYIRKSLHEKEFSS